MDDKQQIAILLDPYCVSTDREQAARRAIVSLTADNARLREALGWNSEQFKAIRLYTRDGETAAACADGEAHVSKSLATGGE